jgi:hypothetical protein
VMEAGCLVSRTDTGCPFLFCLILPPWLPSPPFFFALFLGIEFFDSLISLMEFFLFFQPIQCSSLHVSLPLVTYINGGWLFCLIACVRCACVYACAYVCVCVGESSVCTFFDPFFDFPCSILLLTQKKRKRKPDIRTK